MSRSRFALPLFLMTAVVFSFGCGAKSDHPELGKVAGVVMLDGAPLADATVEFRPEKGRPSNALTAADGRYSVLYTPDAAGALIGTHTVLISTARYAPQPDGSMLQMPEKIPAKFNQKSELTREVKKGSNEFNFELTSK